MLVRVNTESRKLARYRLSAPVVFSWTDTDDLKQHAEGITRDISGGGLFIWSEACPPVGINLRCEVFLPKVNPYAQGLQVVSAGKITRLERPSNVHHREGFAVVLGAPVLVRVGDGNGQQDWILSTERCSQQ
jgi:hypothetical protein